MTDEPCNFCKRIVRNVGIIKQFSDIEDTGDLPEGFEWDTIKWHKGQGWKGYIRGPKGATAWLKVRKIPSEAFDSISQSE
jgi:hypothetical protein